MHPAQMGIVLCAAFFAVCFLQSGIDKVSDRKGNLDWLTGHFANSPLKGLVPLLLLTITLLEIGGGVFCAIGIVGHLAFSWSTQVLAYAFGLCGLTLLCLFAGQRIAKDYVGAATLVGYFAVAILGLVLCQSVPAEGLFIDPNTGEAVRS
ncbi:MAG TPA: hypothetical protein PKA27_07695 [Fimbriimonadaceae bacterium]|nr:hypothetical protein [Fimbriimonadaceae bacterium]